ncbi:hypothetical protein [Prevotella sp.]
MNQRVVVLGLGGLDISPCKSSALTVAMGQFGTVDVVLWGGQSVAFGG